ncbi:alpha/beta hydrolase [Algoriphagus jejuensis]|uniref:Alpha/beta hydrolase n=2 Tax=Algoriphagus jejuensis TaxID=419934 RepID=A0ABP3YH57_9BACT
MTYAQERILYKEVDTTKLYMEVYYPEQSDAAVKKPAMVFFFGGGWNGGSIKQFEPHAKHYAAQGIVCFLVDYRVKSRQGTTPFESLEDAKSAIRFIRKNRDQFGIDTAKIIGAGGSAGGHLAAAAAFTEKYNSDTDDLSYSSKPNALVLFNPVIDNGPGGYGYERIGEEYKDFSPLHNIHQDAPPTIIFLGTADNLIPVETAQYYRTVMEKVGSRCELKLYEGQGHGFFNFDKTENYQRTIREGDAFLQSLGLMN